MPLAATVNVAVSPAVTDWLVGCVVMPGAVTAGLTVSVVALLVALPVEFVTTTTNFDPLFAVVVAGVV